MSRAGFVWIALGAAVIVYINSFRGVFQLDDYNVIVFNPAVHSWNAFLRQFFPGIRPLLKLTYTLNWTSSAGLFGFHVFNLAVHLINTLLVYNLTVSFLRDCRPGFKENIIYPTAFLTTVLFALHPIQTEAVTYICGRSSSLAAMFYMGSLAAYVRGSRDGKKLYLYGLSPLLFLLGVATKESAITLPLALVLYEITAGQDRTLKRIISHQWVHWMFFAFIIAVVTAHPRYRFILLYSFSLRGFRENLLGQANAAGDLIFHILMPNRLNIDPGELSTAPPAFPQTATIIVLVSLAVTALVKRWAWLFFGIAWFFLNILVIILIPRIDSMSDRHFYQAGWGIFLVLSVVLVSVFFRCFKSFRSYVVFIACVSIILGAFTVSRNHVFRSEVALWEDTVKKSPSNARAYNNLGYAYYLAGHEAEARGAYLKALEIDPEMEHARNNLNMLGAGKDSASQASD